MKVLLMMALGYAVVLLVKGLAGSVFSSAHRNEPTDALGSKMVQDPVCEVYLPRDRAIEKTGKEGPVYFCSQECAEEYAKKGQPIG